MKAKITFKDPDTLYDCLDYEKQALVKSLMSDKGLSKAGAEAEAEERMQPLHDLAGKFFKYSEYVTIELDSEAQTATVVPAE